MKIIILTLNSWSWNISKNFRAADAELGDFDPRRHTLGYVSEFRFVSNQNAELENRIGEIHKELT
ncbi:band 4.1-like protein 4 isoform X1 [Aphis craccivora]|uniref:Band 4.1-like protein 4 isoform X1 n=1 Tax=Aphis craccivora TaxID=307492 RepID=A0A6G0ZNS5_APHCR|nr:band 4.1-like protein 4 isoform X1 [Aphis craccivora]